MRDGPASLVLGLRREAAVTRPVDALQRPGIRTGDAAIAVTGSSPRGLARLSVSSRRAGESLSDRVAYPKGVSVSDADMATLYLRQGAFHEEWNYSLLPRQRLPLSEAVVS